MPVHLRALPSGLVALAGLAAMPPSAALPPQHQRAAELKAVIADVRVAGAFGGVPVERVEYIGPDLYRASAGRCRLDVAIVDLPTPRDVSGGRRFEVRPGTVVCAR